MRGCYSRNGQSLIELLVAIGIGAILIVGAFAIFSPSLRSQGDALHAQAASALGKELFENVRSMSEGNWHTLDTLSTSTVKYYLRATSSPFSISTGTENILLGTTTYTRYFILDDVYRNTGKIDTAGSYDPSTKKITVFYGWGSGTTSMVSYLGRVGDSAFSQTDWSGGAGQNGPITSTSTNVKFSTSSNITYSTSTGSIVIQGF